MNTMSAAAQLILERAVVRAEDDYYTLQLDDPRLFAGLPEDVVTAALAELVDAGHVQKQISYQLDPGKYGPGSWVQAAEQAVAQNPDEYFQPWITEALETRVPGLTQLETLGEQNELAGHVQVVVRANSGLIHDPRCTAIRSWAEGRDIRWAAMSEAVRRYEVRHSGNTMSSISSTPVEEAGQGLRGRARRVTWCKVCAPATP